MKKTLRLLVAIIAVVATLSSCKKTTDISILTGHKWSLTTAAETYSDSAGVSHNLLSTTCVATGYTEFHDYAAINTTNTSNPMRLAYNYNTSTCPGYFMPNIGISSWNIDPDNTALYLNGNLTDGTGGNWNTITTLNSSTLVLTYVYQRQIGNTGAPNFNPIYDTRTQTFTYNAK